MKVVLIEQKVYGPFATEVAANEFCRKNGGEVLDMSRAGIAEDHPIVDVDYEIVDAGAWLTVGPFAVRLDRNTHGDLRFRVWPNGQENGTDIIDLTIPAAGR